TSGQGAVPGSNGAVGQGMAGAAGRCTKIRKEFAPNVKRGAAQETVLRARFVGNRLRGNEICLKTTRVRIEQLLNSLVAVGLQNETRVVILPDAVNDFGVGICGSIRVLLARERENDSGVFAMSGR